MCRLAALPILMAQVPALSSRLRTAAPPAQVLVPPCDLQQARTLSLTPQAMATHRAFPFPPLPQTPSLPCTRWRSAFSLPSPQTAAPAAFPSGIDRSDPPPPPRVWLQHAGCRLQAAARTTSCRAQACCFHMVQLVALQRSNDMAVAMLCLPAPHCRCRWRVARRAPSSSTWSSTASSSSSRASMAVLLPLVPRCDCTCSRLVAAVESSRCGFAAAAKLPLPPALPRQL